MTTLTEGQHPGEFLVSEANGSLSREKVTLLDDEIVQAGQVLGQVTVGSVSAAADSGNTGNGTIGSVSAGTGVRAGVYVAVCVEPASNGGAFILEDPDGNVVGDAVVAAAFTGQVNFTIADGSTDYAVGDRFLITVAAGNGKYRKYDPANTDGSQTAVAIAYDNTDATSGDKSIVAIVRDAEVNAAELIWFSGANDNQKAVATAQLKQRHIIAR